MVFILYSDTADPIKIYVTQNYIWKSTDLRIKIRLRFILSGKFWLEKPVRKKNFFSLKANLFWKTYSEYSRQYSDCLYMPQKQHFY